MRYLAMAALILLTFLSACSSTSKPSIKNPDLKSLEGQANYITSKNACKKLAGLQIAFTEKPFLLGAFDARDGIDSRVPEKNYQDLLNTSHSDAPKTPSSEGDEAISELPTGLRSPDEQLSYLTAREIAKSFGKNGIPILPASMALGLADAQTKDKPQISAKDEKIIVKLIQEKVAAGDNDWAENRNIYYRAEEKAFFAQNITKPKVQALNSGVQYLIVKKGKGKTPKANDSVVVNYKGLRLDGNEFDSSYKRKKPETFKLSSMIAGFGEVMTQVPEGSHVIMYIPSALAYGEKGNEVVPPFAAIIFEVDFVNIKTGFF